MSLSITELFDMSEAWDSEHLDSGCAYFPDCSWNGDHPNPYMTTLRQSIGSLDMSSLQRVAESIFYAHGYDDWGVANESERDEFLELAKEMLL